MKELNFKYIRAKNFLCFGPDGIELDLTNFTNIIHVVGENLDAKPDDGDGKKCSNASGKSSIPEILVYGLFGKTIKPPKKISHGDVVNNIVKKGLEIEIILGDFRILRTRKPNSLRFWASETAQWNDDSELTFGDMRETQKMIETRLGISYETFVNLVVFTDNNAGTFLESDGPQKRQIIDNLLRLVIFRRYAEATKKARKKIQADLDKLLTSYERVGIELESSKKRVSKIELEIQQWRKKQVTEYNNFVEQVKKLKEKLANSDMGAAFLEYNEAQETIASLNNKIPLLEAKRQECDGGLSQGQDKLNNHKAKRQEFKGLHSDNIHAIANYKKQIENSKKVINNFETLDGQECSRCLGVVSEDNYGRVVKEEKASVKENTVLLAKIEAEQAELDAKIESYDKSVIKIEAFIKKVEANKNKSVQELHQIRNEILELSKIKEPEASADERLLQQKIENLKAQAVEKKAQVSGPSPMDEILKLAKVEIDEKIEELAAKKEEVKSVESLLPYYEFWEKAFGDAGIRKFIIDGIVPALNARVAYWLQFLINNRKTLVFDNQLEETIKRNPPDGNPFVFSLLSNSERRLMNLAVLLSFAHVMSISCGFSPSLVFLDEVSTNIDPTGIEGVYNMICELAKEKKVFVTTHERDLQEKLDGCETLKLQMKDHFSKIIT